MTWNLQNGKLEGFQNCIQYFEDSNNDWFHFISVLFTLEMYGFQILQHSEKMDAVR